MTVMEDEVHPHGTPEAGGRAAVGALGGKYCVGQGPGLRGTEAGLSWGLRGKDQAGQGRQG